MCNRKPNHDPQEKLNYFSHFWGPYLSPSVTHERPGTSDWEPVYMFDCDNFVELDYSDSTSQVVEDALHPPPSSTLTDPRRSRDPLRGPPPPSTTPLH